MCSHVFMIFRPALRFLTRPFPPGDFAARLLAAVILPPLLFLAILGAPPVHDGNLWLKSVRIKGTAAAEANRTLSTARDVTLSAISKEDVRCALSHWRWRCFRFPSPRLRSISGGPREA